MIPPYNQQKWCLWLCAKTGMNLTRRIHRQGKQPPFETFERISLWNSKVVMSFFGHDFEKWWIFHFYISLLEGNYGN